MLETGADMLRAVRDEGEKAYPNECCGFVLGTFMEDGRRKIETFFPMDNAREAEEQYHRFKIEPEDFMRVEKEVRVRNLDVIGFYHSHPDHPAQPSDYDREHALPFYSYIIVSVEGGKARDITSWELAADRAAFTEEEILWR
ncbi:MAG: M67 family metallopeptidase [Treponema sp.]|jgi:proteasome lid subunit RPN8/RPN11|nr:M67 family metallopeptidase [Treponema sp.]